MTESEITITDTDLATTSFTMIDKDVEITAKFKLKHDITVNCEPSVTGCQATANPTKAAEGTSVTLTATTTSDDYVFDE